jgi:hypothetical protein
MFVCMYVCMQDRLYLAHLCISMNPWSPWQKSVIKQSHPVSQHLPSDIYVDCKLTIGMCMCMVHYDKILCNRLNTTTTFTYN